MNSKDPKKPKAPGSETADENRTIDLLKKIQSGRVDPKCITNPDRKQLVESLMESGYSTADMAQILLVSDRTIERDKQAIRQSHALTQDPKLVEQMVGRLLGEAELSVQRIRKATRDKDTPVAIKVDGEHRCYQIVSDLTQRFQSLGYLPIAAQKLKADLIHHTDEIPGLADLEIEVQRIMEITPPGQLQTIKKIKQLENEVTRASIAERAESLSNSMEGEAS